MPTATSDKISREALLGALEAAQAGLAQRAIVEQSDAFVLKGGRVITFNDQVACRAPTPLPKKLTAAVNADKLLGLLRKAGDEHIEVKMSGGELLLAGKGWNAGVAAQAEITLAVDAVEEPGEWAPLPDDFADALGMVHRCASLDETKFVLTCVRLAPKVMEASDDVQVCRWKTALPVSEPTLLQRSSARHLVALGVTELSESPEWLHFRNAAGLVISCRRYATDEFPDLAGFLKFDGVSVTLPKGLDEAAALAETFSADDQDHNEILVELLPNRVRVTGRSATGWVKKRRKLNYSGEPMGFLISPQILSDIVGRHPDVVVAPDRLRAGEKPYQYMTVLCTPEEAEAELRKKSAKGGGEESGE